MRSPAIIGTILLACLHWAPDVRAAEITLTAFSGACSAASSTQTDVANTVPLETSCLTSDITGDATAQGSFIGDALTLGTFATVTTLTRNLDFWSAIATATFEDTVVPTTTGFAEFSWLIEGSVTCGACNPSTDFAGVELAGNGQFFLSLLPSTSGTVAPTLATFSVPTTAGEPIDLSFLMFTQAHIENSFPGTTETADFLNTAALLSVAMLDANGDPIAGSLISNSGLTYPVASPAPEPSALVMFGTGLVSIGGLQRRRRSRNR